MKCTNSELGRLIARYELGAVDVSERETFVSHLIECGYCHNQVYAMAPFMAVLREHRETVLRDKNPSHRLAMPGVSDAKVVPPIWVRRPLLLAASLLVAVGTGLLAAYFVGQRIASREAGQPGTTVPEAKLAKGTGPAWPDVEIPKAEYIPPGERPLLRGVETETAFEQAMVAYQQNDFVAAAKQLEVVARLEPEQAEAYFYWGVSLLLAGQSQDAVVPLRQAVQLSTGAQRESSRYYLALAYLKTNQPTQALAELEAVIDMRGQHKAPAEKLKQELVGTLK